jgi:hypothetical protein
LLNLSNCGYKAVDAGNLPVALQQPNAQALEQESNVVQTFAADARDEASAATVTICGTIAPGTKFDPNAIA